MFVPIASLHLLKILCSVPGAVKILLLVQIQTSSERGVQLGKAWSLAPSEQAPPRSQHGLPPPSTPPLFLHRKVADMEIWAQRCLSACLLSTLAIEAGGSQTSCQPRLHNEAMSQKLRKEKTCR